MPRAVVCHAFGPIDDLVVEERPDEPCGPGQVRVKVAAAGVNFVDGLFVEGRYQVKPPLPFVPGGDIAGTVVEVGDAVQGRSVGDRVMAVIGWGGFADEVVVSAAAAVPVPDAVTDGQAATFAQSYMTAWFALRRRADARSGQSLLVFGSGGGVGLAAVDVGRLLGLQVIAVASSHEKREAAQRAGAAAVLDVTDDVKQRARDLSEGGVDLVYDPVGGDLAEQGLRALREDGQFLVIGFASGTIPRLPANQILLRNRRVVGVEWGAWALRHPAENLAMLDEVTGHIAAGRLHPVEPTLYPLDDAVRALRDLAERRAVGKLALVP